MLDASDYEAFVKVIKLAKDQSVQAIIVFKPNEQNEQGDSESPDMIVCTSNKPNVIAALLGNYQVDATAVEEDNNEISNRA